MSLPQALVEKVARAICWGSCLASHYQDAPSAADMPFIDHHWPRYAKGARLALNASPELAALIAAAVEWNAWPVEDMPFGVWDDRKDKLVCAVENFADAVKAKP